MVDGQSTDRLRVGNFNTSSMAALVAWSPIAHMSETAISGGQNVISNPATGGFRPARGAARAAGR